MKIRKLAVSAVDSEASSSTSSQTTALAGSPGAARSARSAARESATSIRSTEIEPRSCTPSSSRSASTMLAASRATSHSSTSPSGRIAAPRSTTMLQTAGDCSHAHDAAVRSGGTTMRRCTMAADDRRAGGGASPTESHAARRVWRAASTSVESCSLQQDDQQDDDQEQSSETYVHSLTSLRLCPYPENARGKRVVLGCGQRAHGRRRTRRVFVSVLPAGSPTVIVTLACTRTPRRSARLTRWRAARRNRSRTRRVWFGAICATARRERISRAAPPATRTRARAVTVPASARRATTLRWSTSCRRAMLSSSTSSVVSAGAAFTTASGGRRLVRDPAHRGVHGRNEMAVEHADGGERVSQEAVLRRGVRGRVGAHLLDHLRRRHLRARAGSPRLAHAERDHACDMGCGGAGATDDSQTPAPHRRFDADAGRRHDVGNVGGARGVVREGREAVVALPRFARRRARTPRRAVAIGDRGHGQDLGVPARDLERDVTRVVCPPRPCTRSRC